MRRTGLLISLALALTLCGCMVSEQEGNRTHVNSPHPEQIRFHFDTPFNLTILFVRSALLLLVAWWAIRGRGTGGGNLPFVLFGVALVVAAGWWFATGWTRATGYRIDVRSDRLHLQLPSRPELEVSWEQIQAIEVQGMAYDVRVYPDQPFWSTEWKDLTIAMADGSTYEVDLRPLSVEQRGTFWRAIKRKAELTETVSR